MTDDQHVPDWVANLSPGRQTFALGVAVLVVAIFVVAATMAFPAAKVYVGTAGGAALYVVGVGRWRTLPPSTRARWDIKAQIPARSRRRGVLAAAAVWVIILLLTHGVLPDVLVGTVNVLVSLVFVSLFRHTPAEAAAAYEEWRLEQAADSDVETSPESP